MRARDYLPNRLAKGKGMAIIATTPRRSPNRRPIRTAIQIIGGKTWTLSFLRFGPIEPDSTDAAGNGAPVLEYEIRGDDGSVARVSAAAGRMPPTLTKPGVRYTIHPAGTTGETT